MLDNTLFRMSVVVGFTVAVGMFTTLVVTDGGSDLELAFIPSLYQWRTPWLSENLLFPWAFIILIPLRIFPPVFAKVFMNMLSVLLTALVIRRYGGNVLLTLPIFVCPIGYWLFTTAQVDALMLGGFLLLPSRFDLLFLWKPQVVLHAIWARTLRSPKIYLLTGASLLAISLLIWGNWVQAIIGSTASGLSNAWWNRSLWPYGIPFGLAFLFHSVRMRDETFGIRASPRLSLYVNGPSYVGLAAMIAIKWPKLFLGMYFAFWLYVAYKT